MHTIYLITNVINNKKYVGQTTRTIEDRFNEHYWSRNRKEHQKRQLYIDMRKYGLENFDYDILAFVENLEEANQLEKFWINQLHTTNENCGYNMSDGGDFNLDVDEKKIIELYNLHLSLTEVFKETGYSKGTIKKILNKNNIKILSSIEVKHLKYGKKLVAKNKDIELCFLNQYDAAQYIIDNNKTKYKKINDVVSTIFQSLKNKKFNAYGFKWSYA